MTCYWKIFLSLLAPLLLWFMVVMPNPLASAGTDTTLIVDRVDDVTGGACVDAIANDCSLRSAIEIANLAPANNFLLTLAPSSIYTLTLSGCDEDNNLTDDLDVDGQVTLQGQGSTIRNGTTGRVFEVHAGAKLWAQDVTISNGGSCSSGGAGLQNWGNLRLNNVIVRDNNDSGEYGGGLWNISTGTAWLQETQFINNLAGNGGGIYNQGVLTLTNSLLQLNEASDATGINTGRGGGLYHNGTHLLIENSQFLTNTASNYGGGLQIDTDLVMTNTLISGNQSGFSGAGVQAGLFGTSDVFISHSTLQHNVATNNGGGLHISTGTAVFHHTTFYNNEAEDGGGLFTASLPQVTISNSTFYDNSATDTGGAIINLAETEIVNSTFYNNLATTTGSGIYMTDGPMVLKNITIYGNDGDALAKTTTSSMELSNSIVANTRNGDDCNVATLLGSYNLIEDGSCTAIYQQDPELGPLQDNGGHTLTLAPLVTSIAIDSVFNGSCTEQDQVGNERPLDGDGIGLALCDLGAVEYKAKVACNWSEGTTQQIPDTEVFVNVPVGGVGNIDCIAVDEIYSPHPQATANMTQNQHWRITAFDSQRNLAEGYTLSLSLPHAGGSAGDKACRYANGRWDCGLDADHQLNSNRLIRSNVTELSPWAVGVAVPDVVAPMTFSMTVNMAETGWRLSWQDTASGYDMYRSTSPYDGYTYLGSTPDSMIIDTSEPNLVGDVNTHYFYYVVAREGLYVAQPSQAIGEFDFPLVAGD